MSRRPAEPSRASETIHASCCVIGETGMLVRGPSGSGKSSLVLELVERGGAAGHFARLVADDRVRLSLHHGRVVGRPVPPLEGLVEMRGVGLASLSHEPACLIGLVIDLTDEPIERIPEASGLKAAILGVELPRVRSARAGAAALAMRRIRGKSDTEVTE